MSFGSRGAPGALGELIKIVGPEWGIRKRDDSPYYETWLCFYCKIFTYFTSKLDGLLLKLAKICRSTPYHIMYIHIYNKIYICIYTYLHKGFKDGGSTVRVFAVSRGKPVGF